MHTLLLIPPPTRTRPAAGPDVSVSHAGLSSTASTAAAGDVGPGNPSWSAKRDFVPPQGGLTPGTGLLSAHGLIAGIACAAKDNCKPPNPRFADDLDGDCDLRAWMAAWHAEREVTWTLFWTRLQKDMA